MLNIVLPILSVLSFIAGFYIIFKKIPVIKNIPPESVQNRETFFAFLKRILKSAISVFHPKKIKMYTLIVVEKILSRFKLTTLKIHKTIELLSKDIKRKSQQEKWENQWFSYKNKDKNKK